MSDAVQLWRVVKSVNGWIVEHTGQTRMSFQPDQFGKLTSISWAVNGVAPPMGPNELSWFVRNVHARLLGKRFGSKFSDIRRNVCCEYAAELNSKEA